MAFLTPCFVRVEDAAERKKLIEWLKGIGNDLYSTHDGFVNSNLFSSNPFYCDNNVDLFKALAAMNDENDREQWFVVDDGFQEEMVCSKSDVDYDYILSSYNHRKATADDIVKYFKKR